jgi:hypothetical protein
MLLKALNLYAVENRRLLQTLKIVSCSSGLRSSLTESHLLNITIKKASCQLIWHSKYGSHHITIFSMKASIQKFGQYTFIFKCLICQLFTSKLHHQRHVLSLWQPCLLAQPQAVVNCERINRHRQ